MKKYKMRIKDDNAEYNTYGLHVCHDISSNHLWLCGGTYYKYTSVGVESLAKEFIMEEIEKMPHGFVNQYDLIEVEEELYHIVCPYTNQILKRDKDNNSLEWDTPNITFDTEYFQRRFTLKEIEDKYPNMVKMAKKCEK